MLKNKYTFHFLINLGFNLIYFACLLIYILVIASYAMNLINLVTDYLSKQLILLTVFGIFGLIIGVSHLFFNFSFQYMFTVRLKAVIPVISYIYLQALITFYVLCVLKSYSDVLLLFIVFGAALSGYLLGKLIKLKPILQ